MVSEDLSEGFALGGETGVERSQPWRSWIRTFCALRKCGMASLSSRKEAL